METITANSFTINTLSLNQLDNIMHTINPLNNHCVDFISITIHRLNDQVIMHVPRMWGGLQFKSQAC